ncbi:MAG: hypothetical protein QM516_00645 [Limnohabitans sp.]|nr:hypothetical protein [Limnohabitans sp.]
MQRLSSITTAAGIAATVACVGSTHASIAIQSLTGLEGLGAFEGTATWTYTGMGTGTLAFSLTNTSPEDNGGFLTGFAFNVVNGLALTLSSAPSVDSGPAWVGLANVAASPYPNFDFGAALGGSWLGGGSPNNGIAVNDKGSFVFAVTGDDMLLASLDDESIFDIDAEPAFAARFRGFEDGGSDKVPANLPAPGALALGALAALVGSRRARSA